MASHRLIFDRKPSVRSRLSVSRPYHGGARKPCSRRPRNALAASVSYWEEAMGVNVDRMIEASEIARREAVVQDWMATKDGLGNSL